jgi:hypothetical protein
MKEEWIVRQGSAVLLERFVWCDLELLARRSGQLVSRRVWVFGSFRAADTARRRYGCGLWRTMEVERVRR